MMATLIDEFKVFWGEMEKELKSLYEVQGRKREGGRISSDDDCWVPRSGAALYYCMEREVDGLASRLRAGKQLSNKHSIA